MRLTLLSLGPLTRSLGTLSLVDGVSSCFDVERLIGPYHGPLVFLFGHSALFSSDENATQYFARVAEERLL